MRDSLGAHGARHLPNFDRECLLRKHEGVLRGGVGIGGVWDGDREICRGLNAVASKIDRPELTLLQTWTSGNGTVSVPRYRLKGLQIFPTRVHDLDTFALVVGLRLDNYAIRVTPVFSCRILQIALDLICRKVSCYRNWVHSEIAFCYGSKMWQFRVYA